MCVPVYIDLGPSSGRLPCAEPRAGCAPGAREPRGAGGLAGGTAVPVRLRARLGERGHVFGKRSWRCPGASHGPGASPPPHEEHLRRRGLSWRWESPRPQANSRAEGGWCRRIYLRTEAKLNLFCFLPERVLSLEEPRCKCSRWELSRLFFQICSDVATCPEQNRNRIAAQATQYLFI